MSRERAEPRALDEVLGEHAAALDAAPSWGGLVALLERCAELGEGGGFGEPERELVLGMLADTTWKPAARFELGLAAGPGEGITRALELLPELDLSLERARRAQRALVIWSDDAQASEVWELLMSRVSWIERRVLLNALVDGDAAGLVPALSRLGSDTDPVTRAAVVDAMSRIGHVSAQPFLCAALAAGDDAVAARAARALAELGTRAALEPLLGYAETREGEKVARAAIEAIEARHPVDGLAREGALTESEDHTSAAGALSLSSGAGAGDVALYERAALAVRGGVGEARALEAAGTHWRALSAAPRRVGWVVFAHAVVLHDVRTACAWVALALFFTSWLVGPATVSGAAAVSSWFACAALVCAALSRGDVADELGMLRVGSPTYAGVTERTREPRGNHRGKELKLHRYQLTYMDEHGVTWSTWRSAFSSIGALESNEPLPVLCVGQRSVLRSEVSGVRVLADGRLGVGSARGVVALGLILTTLALACAASWRWVGLLVG